MIRSTARSLSIGAVGADGTQFFGHREEAWDLTLPMSEIERFSMVALGAHGDIDLAGARIGTLALTANVSDLVVDASAASVADLSGVVNVGSLKVQLPAEGDVTGSLRIGGGELWICPQPGAGLRMTTTGWPGTFFVDGVEQTSQNWQNPEYASAPHRADLTVHGNFAYIHIDTALGECT